MNDTVISSKQRLFNNKDTYLIKGLPDKGYTWCEYSSNELINEPNIYDFSRPEEQDRYLVWIHKSTPSIKTPNTKIPYFYYDTKIVDVNIELDYLIRAFKKSENILLLDDDWDGEGSKKYSVDVWATAIRFINSYASKMYSEFHRAIIEPFIYHGPSGSIDILWEKDDRTLLININENGRDADYYSDILSKNQFAKGKFEVNNFEFDLIPIPTRSI